VRKLEQVSGRRITDLFDLIVGCSAGGVVALGLGCPSTEPLTMGSGSLLSSL